MCQYRGYTLIELMIAVAVAAILAAIAMPSYSGYVNKGRVADGLSALANYRVQLEQYYQDSRNYGGTVCGVAVPTSSSYFNYTCTLTTAQTYTVTAASNANVGLGGAGAYTYTVDQANNQTTASYAGTALSTNNNCWITSTGQTC